MDFLSREGSPIPAELWKKIDEAVVSTAKKILTGTELEGLATTRLGFIPISAPLFISSSGFITSKSCLTICLGLSP